MSRALRRRLGRLERIDGEPIFADCQAKHLRELAGLVGAVVGRDLVDVPATALPRALDRAVKCASDAELERMIDVLRAAIDPQQA